MRSSILNMIGPWLPQTSRALVVLLLCLVVAGVMGCASPPTTPPATPPTDTPGPPIPPAGPDLSTPLSAVEAYTQWISFAYRIGDSEVATHTFSVWEEVRVNSYVQYNKIEGRLLDQQLIDSEYSVTRKSDATATVAGTEAWEYRYVSADSRSYSGPPHDASYDVTYTVIVEDPKGWVVDSVQVRARGDVK